MADSGTLAGTVVSVSAVAPPTYDAAGFADVTVVYSVVGEVANLGDHGRTYEDVSYTTLGERGTVHLKGTYDESEKPIEMIKATTDAGQVIMETASTSDSDYTFKIAYGNGDIDYFVAKVFSFVSVGGDANAIRRVNATVRIDRQGVVEVPAP